MVSSAFDCTGGRDLMLYICCDVRLAGSINTYLWFSAMYMYIYLFAV